jgi:pimeloyl-ACP methyl ester carboxylesterase
MPFCDSAGHRLFYTHNGVASRGANLVLIHGAGGQARSWPATWRLAGDAARSTGLSVGVAPGRLTNHSIYAVDLPGHGRSPAPPLTTIEAKADHLEAFLEAQGLDRVIPVGHSMGGLVALELARRANPRLVGQVIVASSARLPVTDQILDGLRSDFPATVDFIIKYSFDRQAAPFFPAKAREYSIAAGPDATHTDFAACAAADLRPALPDIALPTLVIASEGDRMVPAKHQHALANALANAECETIAAAGHYPQLERTRAVETAICRFADRLAAT